jgi:AraC-like DNA-binding protein
MDNLGLRSGGRFDIEQLVPDTEGNSRRPGVFRTLAGFIDVALKSSSNVDMWIETRPDRDRTVEFFYQGTFDAENPAFPAVEQFMVALMVRLTRYAAGRDWNPEVANFRAATVPIPAIRRLVGEAEVRCGQTTTSILFPGRRWVDRVEPDRNEAARRERSRGEWSRVDDLVASLREAVRAYLPDGSPDIKLAARLSGMSVRTLQRRLSEQGMTYSHLLEELRHDAAISLLRDPSLKLSDVGRELGYRDPAIFTRAFRRWTGVTPSEHRGTRHRTTPNTPDG